MHISSDPSWRLLVFTPSSPHELSSLSMEGYAMAAGGILVQVPESEGGDALEFLASARDSAPSDESNPTEPE